MEGGKEEGREGGREGGREEKRRERDGDGDAQRQMHVHTAAVAMLARVCTKTKGSLTGQMYAMQSGLETVYERGKKEEGRVDGSGEPKPGKKDIECVDPHPISLWA